MRKLFLVVALVSLTAGVASADVTQTSGAIGAIPDNNPGGITSDIMINLPTDEVITDINITLNGLSHTWAGDIIATVTGPGGEEIDLIGRPGGPGTTVGDSSNFGGAGDTPEPMDYMFVDGGADLSDFLIGLGSTEGLPGLDGSPFVGMYNPETRVVTGPGPNDNEIQQASLLDTFSGLTVNGTWTLTISDNANGDLGEIGSWTLNITSTPIPEPGSLALLGISGLGLAFYRRRK